MDFLVVEQVWAIAMVLFGAFILNTWSQTDKNIESGPHKRHGIRILPKAKPTRGNIMTIAGTLLCLGGMVLFLMHVKL